MFCLKVNHANFIVILQKQFSRRKCCIWRYAETLNFILRQGSVTFWSTYVSCLISELPPLVAIFTLDQETKTKDITGNNKPGKPSNVRLAPGPDGRAGGSTLFIGSSNSYIEFPNNGKLDTRRSMTILAWIYHNGRSGPIFNYDRRGFGVHLWMVGPRVLFVRFVKRSRGRTSSVATYTKKPRYRAWNYIGATYDYNTGVATLWLNSKPVAKQSIGRFELATNYPIRMGARIGDKRAFRGKISCVQVYSIALNEKQIRGAQKRCFKKRKWHGLSCVVWRRTYPCQLFSLM